MISDLTEGGTLPSEDNQITTNYICRRGAPGGGTVLKNGLT